MFLRLLGALLLTASVAEAQVDVLGGGTDCPGLQTAADLDSSFDTGAICTITDGASSSDCSAGAGSTKVTCRHNGAGTWVSIGSGGGGGSSIVLDIGDDGGNDSTGVTEVATNADANSILTEPSADKILIDMSKDWPKADTADALNANPSDCSANQFAQSIVASGNLTCAAIADADVPNTITIDNATLAATATALAANGANCSAGQFPLGVDASGAAETCSTSLSGNASTATALAANGANCSAGSYPLGVDASGATETCTADDDSPDSDAEVPNGITTDLGASGVVTGGTVSTCARFDGSGNLVSATGDCPTGASTITFDESNDGANESSAITHLECSGSGLACDEPSADQAQIALDSTVSLLSQTIESSEITNSTIAAADIANGDHGAFTYSGNVASLDADVVGTANIADADHGVFTYASGVASLDTDAVDVQTHLKDSECTNGQIIKKSGGAWDCGTDENVGAGLNIARKLWVTTDGADTAEGGGDCSTEACCTLAAPCATIQQAINEATELDPPSSIQNVVVYVGPGLFGEKEIVTYNTDTASSRYLTKAENIVIKGEGRLVTIVGASPDDIPNSEFLYTDECVIRLTGAGLVALYDLTVQAWPWSAQTNYAALCTDGGMFGGGSQRVGLSQIGDHGHVIRQSGWHNQTQEHIELQTYDLDSYGTALELQAAYGATGTGFCRGTSSIPFGACGTNDDCGGTCDTDSTEMGLFCADNNDCTGGDCDMTNNACATSSMEHLFRLSLLQTYNRNNIAFLPVHTCEAGATTGASTVEVDNTATCSTNVCSGISGSLSCTTNTDCARLAYCDDTSCDFDGADNVANTADDPVKMGEMMTVGGAERTVRRVRDARTIEASRAWASNGSSNAYTISNDGWPCDTNSDCDTSGVCTQSDGSSGQPNKINYSTILTANDGGNCVDSNHDYEWPPTDCNDNTDCGGSYTVCETSAIYVDAGDVAWSGPQLTLDYVGFVAQGGTPPDYDVVGSEGGLVANSGTMLDSARVVATDSARIYPTGDAVFDSVVVGAGVDTADIEMSFDDDRTSSAIFQWDNTNEAFVLDAKCATNTDCDANSVSGRTSIRVERNASIAATVRGFVTLGSGFLDIAPGTSTGHVRILNSAEAVTMMDCNDNDSDFCTFLGLKNKDDGTTAYKVKAIQNECAVIEKLANTDDDVPLWMPNAAVTVRTWSCRCDERSGSTTGCDTTLATVTLEDHSGNAMTGAPTCTTGAATYTAVSSGGGLTAGEGMRLNVTNTPTDDGLGTYTFCWTYTYD